MCVHVRELVRVWEWEGGVGERERERERENDELTCVGLCGFQTILK